MTASATTCAACGAAATGSFCSSCGTPIGSRVCTRCRTQLSAQARFCHRCGQPAGSAAPAPDRTPWIIAGLAVAILLGAMFYRIARDKPQAPAPDMANAGASGAQPGQSGPPAAAPFAGGGVPNGRAPDISKMTPKERFARLNDRVMEASAKGDSAFVVNFTPMALGAYTQLDTIDVDARYHAAMLNLGIGQFAPALALADTIAREAPNNLFADLVRAAVAQAQNDRAAYTRATAAFLAHYSTENPKRRAEYDDHRDLIEEFHRGATGASSNAGTGPKP